MLQQLKPSAQAGTCVADFRNTSASTIGSNNSPWQLQPQVLSRPNMTHRLQGSLLGMHYLQTAEPQMKTLLLCLGLRADPSEAWAQTFHLRSFVILLDFDQHWSLSQGLLFATWALSMISAARLG